MTNSQQKIILGGMILAICLLMAWILSRGEEPASVISEGSPLPEWAFTDAQGSRHRFGEFQGKVLLVNFWATWCPPCLEELPSLNALAEALKGSPVEILTFSADDSWTPVHELFRRQAYHLPVFDDFQRRLAERFGTLKFPETYIADKSGIVRLKVIGATDWMAPKMVAFLQELSRQ